VVPDELVGGWWTRQQGCETVPQVWPRTPPRDCGPSLSVS